MTNPVSNGDQGQATETAQTTQTPHEERDLVYGTAPGYLVLVPRQRAREVKRLRQALRRARTWADFKAMVTPLRYRDVLNHISWEDEEGHYPWDSDNGDGAASEWDEETPPDWWEPEGTAAFINPDTIWGYVDGDWPDWFEQQALTWVPATIQTTFGGRERSTLNGDYLVLDPERTKEIVAALEEYGYVCAQDEELVASAMGY